MNTKKAIEFMTLGLQYTESSNEQNTINKVIELLKQGEKFEKMWKHLYFEYGEVFLNDYRSPDILLEERMKNIERKYFPK